MFCFPQSLKNVQKCPMNWRIFNRYSSLPQNASSIPAIVTTETVPHAFLNTPSWAEWPRCSRTTFSWEILSPYNILHKAFVKYFLWIVLKEKLQISCMDDIRTHRRRTGWKLNFVRNNWRYNNLLYVLPDIQDITSGIPTFIQPLYKQLTYNLNLNFT